jgi:hypothetical protein
MYWRMLPALVASQHSLSAGNAGDLAFYLGVATQLSPLRGLDCSGHAVRRLTPLATASPERPGY